ncbi:amidohydrolase family protein [Actinomadura sp. LD22]|uniref:Amidohydrolase family protein n=1 Tax=Actinomadura physcomitrii TaxID=2650748 RepID=A0A6I4M279_9ACTN|nr:amidohydrolase family protein [Actinomadura physcomitrii]MVZ99872.1 amidohydrolase family protein [Actinomadura physcomitrii]
MPLAEDVQLVSVDDHVIEPPGVWSDRLPAAMREEGPRIVDGPGHTQAWHYAGREYPIHLQGSPRTRIFRSDGTGEDFFARHYDDMVSGAYDVQARVRAMDEDGVAVQLPFPTFPRFAGTRFLEGEDRGLAALCVRAYNDWMLDEWCAAAPDRFIPTVIVPLWDPVASAGEIRRCAAKGARAVSMAENPAPLGLPSWWKTDHWAPMLHAIEETGLPLCMHIGTSGELVVPSEDSSEAVPISLCGLNSMASMAEIIFSGMLLRFPGLKIALSEGGSGWVPYLLERMDYTWKRTRVDVNRDMAPSELFARNFWTCFISDQFAVDVYEHIGVDKLMWESDYPHNDSEWPDSRNNLEKALAGVADSDAARIAESNARELFDFPRVTNG